MVGLVNLLKCADRLKTLGGIEPQGNAGSELILVHAFEVIMRSPFTFTICTIFLNSYNLPFTKFAVSSYLS